MIPTRFILRSLLAGSLMIGSLHGVSHAQSISPSTYKKLTDIQELLSASQFNQAIPALRELHGKVAKGSLSEAIVLQTWGYAEMANNQYDTAMQRFRQSLAVNQLPEDAAHNVRFMIAQLYAGEGQFKQAYEEANVWYAALETPKPAEHIFMANITAQLKRFDETIRYANAAIQAASQPKENWLQLLLAAYFEKKDYARAADTLKQLIVFKPDDARYWEQLASVNMLLGRDRAALSALRLAWKQNLLDKEAVVKSMVQLAYSEGIPDHAARLLTQAMAQNILPADEDNLTILASAWVAAREDQQAIAAYNRLADVSSSGDPLVRQAKILVDQRQWQAAQQALSRALDRGVENRGEALLLLGITQIEAGNLAAAQTTLNQAQGFDKVANQAAAWLAYAEQKRDHQRWLEENQSVPLTPDNNSLEQNVQTHQRQRPTRLRLKAS